MTNKIVLIIGREYISRVKKKSFIVMTILSPLLIIAFMLLTVWIAGAGDSTVKNIAVVDNTHKYSTVFESNEIYHFDLVNQDVKLLKDNDKYEIIVVIQQDLIQYPDAVTMYSDKHISLELKAYISASLSRFVENEKLAAYHIPGLKQMVEDAHTHINVKTVKWSEGDSVSETSFELAMVTGMFTALLIYMFIFIYGSMVMRGVVEEKSSRIVEIIISSVRPFQLMLGKIIGIALVGLTQFAIWIIILLIALLLTGSAVSTVGMDAMIANQGIDPNMLTGMEFNISGINVTGILIGFLFYFLAGYLLYASLFAAIGAASDSETDTQQFMLPITIPVLFALYAAIYSATNPDSALAFWSSIIPFTSPIVMMVRIPLGVQSWELILSAIVLILSFILTTWFAAKIYRTGILMYGKKVGYKEIWKIIRNT